MGWYNHHNCGDEAFKLVHKNMFTADVLGGANLCWINEKFVQADDDCSFILGAGDVVKPFYVDKLPAGSSFYIYGAGFSCDEDARYAIAIKDRIRGAWMRNRADVSILQSNGVDAHYTPDIIFQLGAGEKYSGNRLSGSKKKAICFFSNNSSQEALRSSDLHLYNDELSRKIKLSRAFDSLTSYYDFEFYPMSADWNDFDSAYSCDIYTMISNRTGVTVHPPLTDAAEALAISSSADLIFSMKYHGLIFACLAGVPFVDIGTTRKNHLFCLENDFTDVSLSRDNFTTANLSAAIKVAEYPPFVDRVKAVRERLIREANVQKDIFLKTIMTPLFHWNRAR
ncbi:polysaccharide pyruvyl transferase family protein [Pararhizobium qamdonense]|uniref:polysaccharide pyruvyl transferase family protein n=1 Tax=Pararhizobium qamdonense TaxID=3031126 RepID=UPI0023E15DB8|nr:polysaccharide pyruvyl transferase family protein [Pararhizobium qamdonense]